jgi:hypothetical protein
MKGILKPCIWVRGLHQEVSVQEGRLVERLDADQKPITRNVNAWCYPRYQQQIGSYEMAYPIVCDESGDEPCLLALPEPLLLSHLLGHGVVMMGELAEAETALQVHQPEEALHGKERITLYKMLTTLMVETYGWNPTDHRSSAVSSLVKDAEELGISMSFNAAKEHCRRAWEKCPPKGEVRQD